MAETIRYVLFCGSFDPAHEGHLAVLRAALGRHPEARGVMAPLERPGGGKRPSPLEDRVRACKAALHGLRAEARGFRDFFSALDAFPPEDTLLLFGPDAFLSLPFWPGAERILAYRLAVAASGAMLPLIRLSGREAELIPAELPDISSEIIRNSALER